MLTSIARLPLLLSLTVPVAGAAGPDAQLPPPERTSSARGSLQEAFAEARRAAHPADEGGWWARNPGQRWTTHFDRRGCLTRPDGGGWTWGLELESYGFAGAMQRVDHPVGAAADGVRVTYRWDETLEEWYVNEARGLEHGYTLSRRPEAGEAADDSTLVLTLGIRGALYPEVESDREGVSFLDDAGGPVLRYTGLRAFDADGRPVPAWFERAGERLRLSIDERDARYPLTIDPIAQQAYLKASNTGFADQFGNAIAVSGDTVVVAAAAEDSSSSGIDGWQGDGRTDSGAVYVFVQRGASWSQEAYVKASNSGSWDAFGSSVALDGDLLVVGAPYEDSSATGVNGDQNNDLRYQSGAAYVFERSGTTWTQVAYLKASNAGYQDWFGDSVAISGETIVVGARREDSSSPGVNGNQQDDQTTDAGAAYVFSRTAGVWSQRAYLKASNPDPRDWFGHSVSISGRVIVVGAHGEDGGVGGVNGDDHDDSRGQSGAAYVFAQTAAGWRQHAYLKAGCPGINDSFGETVAVSGERIVVGARSEDGVYTGVGGNELDNGATNAGAAYVFVRDAGHWSQEAYLKASNTQSMDLFGARVSIAGDTVLVGAPGESSSAVGINGAQNDNGSPRAGAAYLFRRTAGTWGQVAYLKASNTGAEDSFGLAVATSEDLAVVGAIGEDSAATGVDGDQGDESRSQSGAVYVFDLNFPPTGYAFCSGDPGDGTPCPCDNDNDGSVPGSGCDNGYFASGAFLSASGLASVSDDRLVLTTTHAEPGNGNLYVQADNDLSPGSVWENGLRCVGGNLQRLEIRFADSWGTSSTTAVISTTAGNVLPGDTKYYQCWYWATEWPPCGYFTSFVNTSNGWAVTWTP